jgi:hypothetical protein
MLRMSFFVLVGENKIPQVPIQVTAESLVSLVIVSNVNADLCSGATLNETAGINVFRWEHGEDYTPLNMAKLTTKVPK